MDKEKRNSQPPFAPLCSGPKAATKPSRQKQFPNSIEMRQLFRVELDEDISSFPQGRHHPALVKHQLGGVIDQYASRRHGWILSSKF